MDAVSPNPGKEIDGSSSTRWRPRELAFRLFVPGPEPAKNGQALDIAIRRPLVARLTKGIIETYQVCNPQFKYSEELNPKRYLTSPSNGVHNDGFDNMNNDLILTVNFSIVNMGTQRRYIVKDVLGHGTFGQVAKCWVPERDDFVAVKIIKNLPAYYQQALVEVSILTTLNKKYDPEDKHHIVRIYDYFVYQRHLCICFELLDTNLYELIKINQFRGLSLSIVQLFSKQILHGLALLKDAGIIHCDLKPENILLCPSSVKPAEVKIIDFGSACMEDRTVYSYIQSRYYRSPEVLLGYQYTTAIDMWSFGCIVAELFLGLPLFPGASEFDLLRRMIQILGGQPPDHLLKEAKNTSKFFKCIGSFHSLEIGEVLAGKSAYKALTVEEFEARDSKRPSIGKEYFHLMDLEAIVTNYPYRKNLTQEDIIKEGQTRLALIDFLRGLVEFDPAKRWTPSQASKHPFVTGEPFTYPFKPPPETPRMPVAQNCKVDHHPGGGHWFAAGLSPNIPGRIMVSLHNSSHFQMAPYNSYNNIGSYGSYNEGLGSSYGSYGDGNNLSAYYSPVGPSGMNMHPQSGLSMLGSSPDTRHRFQYSHGNGINMSPSAGNFTLLPLGTSPVQFNSPNAFSQFPAGSPGHYGPTSPARSSWHGSPLGKTPPISQYNRRKNWGYSGTSQSQDNSSLRPGQFADGSTSGQAEEHPSVYGSSSHRQANANTANWMQQHGGNGAAAGHSGVQNSPSSLRPSITVQLPQSGGVVHDKAESSVSLPDPGDWDPNYSDELLLQEDGSDVSLISTEFSRGIHLGSDNPTVGFTRSNRGPTSFIPRQSGSIQEFSHFEASSPPSNDIHTGFGRSGSKHSHFMPHPSHNSPSRLGQHNLHRPNQGRPARSGEWSHIKVQAPPSNLHSRGPHSPRSSLLSNNIPWGQRTNHPIGSIPSGSRGRNEHGKIS